MIKLKINKLDNDFDKEFKNKLINMMMWFHDFCTRNNIRYYALGGTMLGAVRHKGFIPWDDDIDIGIPRSDYERLIKIMYENKNKKYKLETPRSESNDYCYVYSKLYDTNTTLVEETKNTIRRGLFIDIFPLDGLGNNKETSYIRFQKINILFYIHIAKITSVRNNRNRLKKIFIGLVNLIPNFILNDKKIILKIDELCKNCNYDESVYVGNLLGHWRYKEVMRKEIMGNPTLYKFESIEIYGVEYYDEYLSNLYGNWKSLPPLSQQKTHHDFLECDLNKSYLL